MITGKSRTRGRPPRTPAAERSRHFKSDSSSLLELKRPKYLQGRDSPVSDGRRKRRQPPRRAPERQPGKTYFSSVKRKRTEFVSDFEDDDEENSESSSTNEEEVPEELTDSDFSVSSTASYSLQRQEPPQWFDRDIPSLELPRSSEDLLIPKEHAMRALAVYEVLRHFRSLVRLTNFRFEDFCAILICEDHTYLLAEIHMNLLKAILREEESQQTHFAPFDQKDSVNSILYFIDAVTWPEVLRCFMECEKNKAALEILDSCDYPFTQMEDRLNILYMLMDRFLETSPVREEFNQGGTFKYDDFCRVCHKCGDLLCCETCPAVFHLDCVDPPLKDVPSDDWQCHLCKNNKVVGVSDCVLDMEKSGLLCRQPPLGFDRHGRKYWFLARRIFIESAEGECWYYSTPVQLEELMQHLDGIMYESVLCAEINENREEVERQMKLTEKLTNQFKGSRKTYLEADNALIGKVQSERKKFKEDEERKMEIAESGELDASLLNGESISDGEEDEAKNGRKSSRLKISANKDASLNLSLLDATKDFNNLNGSRLTRLKAQQISNGTLLFKLGMENSYKSYVNQYSCSSIALNKAQKQEEKEKKRHMSHKFSINANGEYKWPTTVYGNKAQMTFAVRQSYVHLESNVMPVFMHKNWGNFRKSWMSAMNSCSSAADFSKAVSTLCAAIRPIVFLPVWHDNLGHTKLIKITSAEREEKKKCEKKEKKDREDEEERRRLTPHYIKYTLGLKHQVYRQKGEEYRVHGQHGWFWVSGARKGRSCDSRLLGLNAGPAKCMIQVKEEKGIKITALNPKMYSALMRRRSDKEDESAEEGIVLEKEKEAKGELETLLKMNIQEVPKVLNVVNVSKALTAPGRPLYGKVAKISSLDSLLGRRVRMQLEEERDIAAKKRAEEERKEAEAAKVKEPTTMEEGVQTMSLEEELERQRLVEAARKRVEEAARKKAEEAKKAALWQSLSKRIMYLNEKYGKSDAESRLNKCYNTNCTVLKINATLTCYSPICRKRGKIRMELMELLQRARAMKNAAKATDTVKEEGVKTEVESGVEEKAAEKSSEFYKDAADNKSKELIVANDIGYEVEIGATEEVGGQDSSTSDDEDMEEVKEEHLQCTKEEKVAKTQPRKTLKTLPPRVLDDIGSKGKSGYYARKLKVKIPYSRLEHLAPGYRVTGGRMMASPIVVPTYESFFKGEQMVKKEEANGNKNEDDIVPVYSIPDTSKKITLKKFTYQRKKVKSEVKSPNVWEFKTKSGKPNMIVLRKHELMKLSRLAGRMYVTGFSYSAKPNFAVWNQPGPRPLFKTCWQYRTINMMRSLSGVALQYRILWACLKWDEIQARPPTMDYKHQKTTETEIITWEILDKRHFGMFDERTEYQLKKIIVPLDLPKTIREVSTSFRSGLRKRKREEATDKVEPQTIVAWVDESKLELWEIKQYAERLEKAVTMSMLRPRVGGVVVQTARISDGSDAAKIEEFKEQMRQMQLKKTQETSAMSPHLNKNVLKSGSVAKQIEDTDLTKKPQLVMNSSQLASNNSNPEALKYVYGKSNDGKMRVITMPGGKIGPNNPQALLIPTVESVGNTKVLTIGGTNQKIYITSRNNGEVNTEGLLPGQKVLRLPGDKFQVIMPVDQVGGAKGAMMPAQPQRQIGILVQNTVRRFVNSQDVALTNTEMNQTNKSSINGAGAMKLVSAANRPIIPVQKVSVTPLGSAISSGNLMQLVNGKATISTINGRQVLVRNDGANQNVFKLLRGNQGGSMMVPGTNVMSLAGMQNTAHLLAKGQPEVGHSRTPPIRPKKEKDLSIDKMKVEEEETCDDAKEGDGENAMMTKCIMAKLLETSKGTTIVLDGLNENEYTQEQMVLIREQVKNQMLKAQASGHQMSSDTKIILSMQTPRTKQEAAVKKPRVYKSRVKKESAKVKKMENKEVYSSVVTPIPTTAAMPMPMSMPMPMLATDFHESPPSSKMYQRKRPLEGAAIHPSPKKMDHKSVEKIKVERSVPPRISQMEAERKADLIRTKLHMMLLRQRECLKKDMLRKRAHLEKELSAVTLREMGVEAMTSVLPPPPPYPKMVPSGVQQGLPLQQKVMPMPMIMPQHREERRLSGREAVSSSGNSMLEAALCKVSSKPAVTVPKSSPKKVSPPKPKGKYPKSQHKKYKRNDYKKKKAKKREQSTSGESAKFSKNKLMCICRTPYDDTKFYVGCDLCNNWFHGDCVGLDEKMCKGMTEYVCDECTDATETHKLYCLCQQPYDKSQFYICCDKCDDWFHGRCVGILQSEASHIDEYICPKCQRNTNVNYANMKNLSAKDFESLKKLMKQIQTHKSAWPFMEPVDPEEAPDYYEFIKEPMDLSTIEKRIINHEYKRLSDFIADMTKIFDNCRYYNPKESMFNKCADSLEAFFASKVKTIRDKLLDGS